MYIRKESQLLYRVVSNRDFFDTELPEELTTDQINKILDLQESVNELDDYLYAVYHLKRQGASTKGVELPACLREQIEEAVAEQLSVLDTEAPSSKVLQPQPSETA